MHVHSRLLAREKIEAKSGSRKTVGLMLPVSISR
jgi:hypothetical protein